MQDMSCLDDYDGMTDLQNNEDFQAVLNSPLSASLADLAYSSGQTMFTDLGRSPLPSPSFTYPTPPASQEGQSPSLNFHSVMSNGHLGDFFYSSDMSSSEAVEAALSEVLPNFESATDSPLSANTPVSSPMSIQNPSSAAASPLPNHHQHTLQVRRSERATRFSLVSLSLNRDRPVSTLPAGDDAQLGRPVTVQ